MPNFAAMMSTIVRTDILFRFRRTATVVTLLVVAAAVYFIVPAVNTGRTLMQVDGRRVLYNSAAVALGTGMFCALFMSMFGFYLVSNSFRRDIQSRTGFIIAATPVTNARYVLGKFAGNVVYLSAVMLACMFSAMVMFLLRGEGTLQPVVFLATYASFVFPSILFGSAAALAFEALPALSGRLGDVVYFFLWGAVLGLPASMIEAANGPDWLRAFDIIGFIPMIEILRGQFHTTTMSIGASSFNVARPPILFPGIDWNFGLVGQRMSTLILPALLLVGAQSWFHRFNPTRIKSSARHARRNVLAWINGVLKPVTRFVQQFATARGGRISLGNAVRADVFATFALSPLSVVAIVVFGIISLFIDTRSLREGVLPAIIVALVIALADIATRDRSSGMMSLLVTAPKIKSRYIGWKFASALVVTTCFTLIPLVRLAIAFPHAASSLLIGSCFLSAGAIGFGVLVRSQKLFIAFSLMLLYISLNAPDSAVFDFAGFSNRATSIVQFSYAALTLSILLVAHARHKFLMRSS